MRKLRLFIVSLFLVALATPMFACLYCEWDGLCYWTPYTTPKCKPLRDGGCTDGLTCFGSQATEELASGWEIASVEVKSGDDVTLTTAQTAVAQLDHDHGHTH